MKHPHETLKNTNNPNHTPSMHHLHHTIHYQNIQYNTTHLRGPQEWRDILENKSTRNNLPLAKQARPTRSTITHEPHRHTHIQIPNKNTNNNPDNSSHVHNTNLQHYNYKEKEEKHSINPHNS